MLQYYKDTRSSNVIIEEAKHADVESMIDLLTILFSKEAEFVPNRRIQAQGLTPILEDEHVGKIFVLREGSRVIGMVSLLWSISTALGGKVAFLEDMILEPSFQGKGLGSQLITHAIDYAKKQKCKRITLLSDNDNTDAHRFYERFGFEHSSMLPMRLIF